MDKQTLEKQYVNSYRINKGRTFIACIALLIIGLLALAGIITFVVSLMGAIVEKFS